MIVVRHKYYRTPFQRRQLFGNCNTWTTLGIKALTAAQNRRVANEEHALYSAWGVYPEAWNLYTARFVWAARTCCRTRSCYPGSSDGRSPPCTSILGGCFAMGILEKHNCQCFTYLSQCYYIVTWPNSIMHQINLYKHVTVLFKIFYILLL